MNKCACSCHIVDEINVICYSCECDIEKMPTKQNTINSDNWINDKDSKTLFKGGCING